MALTTDIERLELVERKRSGVVDAMGRVSTRFVAQVAEELPERWEQIVRSLITNRPYQVKALGSDDLSRLKKELRSLQRQADEVAAKHLNGPKVWRHQEIDADDTGCFADQPDGSPFSSRTDRQQRWSRVSGALSRAEDEVVCLLEPLFGDSGAPWLQSGHGKLSAPLEQMIEAYEQLNLQLEQIETERVTLCRRIATEEAQELWENA